MSTSPQIGILAAARSFMAIAHPNVRWPDPNQAWEMPQTGHIDGYGGRWLQLMLVATAYLYDI